MASELQNINVDRLKCLAVRHSSKLIGVAVGVSSVLILTVTWSLLTSRSDVSAAVTCTKGRGPGSEGGRTGGTEGGGSCTGESCPWQFVLSDLTNRLHLLEAAFKEQVLAREMMAQEVSNQSDSNGQLEQKLVTFMRRLEEVERLVRRVENRVHELSARLYSDDTISGIETSKRRPEEVERMVRRVETRVHELSARLYSHEFIGFVVILAIMVEVLLRVRPRVAHIRPLSSDIMARYRRWSQGPDVTITASSPVTSPAAGNGRMGGGEGVRTGGGEGVRTGGGEGRVGEVPQESHSNGSAAQVLKTAHANGVSFSPKHGLFLKPELCVIAFRKDHAALTNFIDTTIRHLDDVKLSVKPYYVIESHEHLRQCPRAKLYLVIFEMEERVSSGPMSQDADLITSTVRYVKSLKANLILIVTNDEGSRKLTVHALYNTHLRLLQSHEAFQDLTSSGRVFSAWRELTSHQTSHMRKIVKTALSLKPSLR